MEEFFRAIDVNGRLSAEQHSLLCLFAVAYDNSNLKYDDLIIYEDLIIRFNASMSNISARENFKKIVESFDRNEINQFIQNFNAAPWEYEKPVIWGDRQRSQYYIDNLTLSHRYEVFIERQLKQRGINLGLYYGRDEQYNKGENELGIEIKRDIKSRETGNLYIEYAERLNPYGDWVASGIFKDDNTNYFLVGDIDECWILRRCELEALYNEIDRNGGRLRDGCRRVEAARGTSLGFIIPKAVANNMSLNLDELVEEIR